MKRALRVIAILFSVILILIVILQAGVSILLPKIIKDKLEETVAKASNGKYHLEIGKVSANIFNRSVGIHHAQLQFDSSAFVTSSDSFRVKWRGEIEHIAISGIDVISFIRHKDISVQQVILIGSNVEMVRPLEEMPDEDSVKSTADSLQNLFINFRSIKVGSVITRKMSFAIFNQAVDALPSFQTENINVNLKTLTFDSSTLYSHHRLFDAENASAVIRDIQFITPDSLFTLSIPYIEFAYNDYSVHIDSLHFSPRYSREDFMKKISFEKDYLDISVKHLDLERANIKGILEKNECRASVCKIDSLIVQSYRDKNLADDRRVKPMPLDLLNKSPFPISIDSLLLHNASATYIERTCDVNSAGKVWFTEINATITHVTNDSFFHRHDTLVVQATGLLMGEGKTTINFQFPLFSPSQSFFGSGSIGKMSMKRFNPMLEKNAFISIKDGMMNKAEFTIEADAFRSKGKLLLTYNDLEIAKLNDDGNSEGIENRMISVIANLLLRKNNPEANGDVKQASMYWHRDPSRSIFNYVWKTLLSGVKETLRAPAGKNTTIGITTCP